nr:PREDICTED: uncharacterized protein KIAA1755-like [Latimeria chalumnae]|eukprot:XP_014354220.1 PREDICTED: uncharacterized protein KIAA1755-like [Latimeria chalumnae]
MNPESLDTCIQNSLSVLYPPFEATAPTVLSQLFRVIESSFHGDGLHCLLDFLIPAKRILESVQQAACAAYSNFLFRHEGWPLCLHEKVVLQLACLNSLLLRPGDFYLQVEPFGDQSACIVLKCLSRDLRNVEEILVPEISYPGIFTLEWLKEINNDREDAILHTCLVATDNGIVKVPWTKIAIPEFVDKPKTKTSLMHTKAPIKEEMISLDESKRSIHPVLESCNSFSSIGDTQIDCTTDSKNMSCGLAQTSYQNLIKFDQAISLKKPVGFVSPSMADITSQDLEGDYVDLLDFSKENHAFDSTLTSSGRTSAPTDMAVSDQSISSGNRPFTSSSTNGDCSLMPISEKWMCGRTIKFAEDPCTPCLRRKLNKDSNLQETRCRYRESYMAALQNPVHFDSGMMAVILEENDEHKHYVSKGSEHTGTRNTACCRRNCDHRSTCKSFTLSTKEIKPLELSSQEGISLKQQQSPVHNTTSPLTTSDKNLVKEQRTATSTVDNVSTQAISNQLTGHCKRTSSGVCASPKVNRCKAVAKDSNQTFMALPEVASLHSVETGNGKAPVVNSPIRDHLGTECVTKGTTVKSQDLNSALLYSGVLRLPGNRDKQGRAVVQVCTNNDIWKTSAGSGRELTRLLLYFLTIPRKEVRDLGLTVVVDARRQSPPPALSRALLSIQASLPQSVHSVLVLVDKETSSRVEKLQGIQMETLTSLKVLNKFIDNTQLTRDLDGTFPYSHSDWIHFYLKMNTFAADLREAYNLLQNTIRKFEISRPLTNVQEVLCCISEHKAMMKSVLEDARLVHLQMEGGAILAKLRKEESQLNFSEDYRDGIESVTLLYNQVEENVHMLVMKSNESFQHLNFLLELRHMEDKIQQLCKWIDEEGESHLKEPDILESSLENLEKTKQNFNRFFVQATEQYNKGLELLEEANKFKGLVYPELEVFKVMKGTLKSKLSKFRARTESQRTEQDILLSLYRFNDKVSQFTLECKHYLVRLSLCSNQVPNVEGLKCLETYHQKLSSEFSGEVFQKMKVHANNVSGSKGMKVWNTAWLKCQEVRQLLEERLGSFRKAQKSDDKGDCYSEKPSTSVTIINLNSRYVEKGTNICVKNLNTDAPSEDKEMAEQSRYRSNDENNSPAVTCFSLSIKPEGMESAKDVSSGRNPSNHKDKNEHEDDPSVLQKSKCRKDSWLKIEDGHPVPMWRETIAQNCNNEVKKINHSPKVKTLVTYSSQVSSSKDDWFPWTRISRSHSDDSCSLSSHSDPISFSACPRGHPSKKIMEAAQHFQLSRHGSFCTEEVNCLCSPKQTVDISHINSIESPMLHKIQGKASKHGKKSRSHEKTEGNLRKLQHILEELLITEKDYVSSLGYIMTHYFPEMERMDLPRDLRGKRGTMFGNLEKLFEFHSQYFLKELEGCRKDPLGVGRIFLKYKKQFALYALYSKNKPQSDALLLNHGYAFFKRKQQELGDKMDLSSYLLKPIQRISKYNLLLKDMVKELGSAQEKEHKELQAAQEVVKFQLRHGNDLLTMDAIQECDVNLKEQGQLIRQDEFVMSYRKRKCLRHIFLFQDLILFSKTKKTDKGNDVYIYKQSFKTSEIGMTHNSGDSGLCFEIWFRRRKFQDTYILQASSPEVKDAWTADLEQILWDQALRNRELNIQERVFMGIGSKPFMDLQPSEAAISDRAINCIIVAKEVKHKSISAGFALHDLISTQRPNSIGSRSSTSSSGSHSSSSSGRGSLSPQNSLSSPYLRVGAAEIERCFYNAHASIVEDEVENDAEGQISIMDSSESSGESVSGFSSSEQSCLSLIGGEVEDCISVFSESCKPSREPVSQDTSLTFPQSTTPAQSPRSEKKEQTAPKYLTVSQADDMSTCHSTEV